MHFDGENQRRFRCHMLAVTQPTVAVQRAHAPGRSSLGAGVYLEDCSTGEKPCSKTHLCS